MIDIEIRDLKPIQGPAHAKPRPSLQQLSDDELAEAVRNPANADFLTINTRTGILVDGNGRAHELLRRVSDPNSTISPHMRIPVQEFTPDFTMFPDLD